MDTYARRATKAFSFLWSFLALVVTALGLLLGAVTEPAPDWFIILFGILTGCGAGITGFMHGVTLAAARNLDAQREAEEREVADTPRCYAEYCTGASCQYRHD